MGSIAKTKEEEELVSSFLSLIIDQIWKVPKRSVKIAVNCAGPEVTDSYGIYYMSDVGHDAGAYKGDPSTLAIGGVPMIDQPLYRYERYFKKSFSYPLPQLDDGDYVLVIKLNESYIKDCRETRSMNFDLGYQRVASDVNLFKLVGKNHAYDLLIEFRVINYGHCLVVNGEKTDISSDFRLHILQCNGWPEINAFCIVEGTLATLPIKPPSPPKYLQDISVTKHDSAESQGKEACEAIANLRKCNDQERLKAAAKAMVKSGLAMQVLGNCLLTEASGKGDGEDVASAV